MDRLDFNRLWQNFTDTISRHYVDFDGRVNRPQFWWYVAVYIVVGVLVSIIAGITFTGSGLRALYGLALLLPTPGITSRRLHDMGRTASWVLLLAVPWVLSIVMGFVTLMSMFTFGLFGVLTVFWPIVGLVSLAAILLLIYFCAQPGTPGPNEYGAGPPPWTPNTVVVTPSSHPLRLPCHNSFCSIEAIGVNPWIEPSHSLCCRALWRFATSEVASHCVWAKDLV